jgi:hypothetical protein
MLDEQGQLHAHEDDLELYISGRLELERTSPLEQHLLECNICQECLAVCLGQQVAVHLVQGTKPESAQKRSEPRFKTEGEATVQGLHPLSMERHKVTIVNVSKNGFGILSPKAILPGTIVQIRIKDTVELGNVRYCSAPGDDGFKIGVRMHDEG